MKHIALGGVLELLEKEGEIEMTCVSSGTCS